MNIQIESTDEIVEITHGDSGEKLHARVWKGVTERGVACHLLITRIAVDEDQDCAQFEAELKETAAAALSDPYRDLKVALNSIYEAEMYFVDDGEGDEYNCPGCESKQQIAGAAISKAEHNDSKRVFDARFVL